MYTPAAVCNLGADCTQHRQSLAEVKSRQPEQVAIVQQALGYEHREVTFHSIVTSQKDARRKLELSVASSSLDQSDWASEFPIAEFKDNNFRGKTLEK